MKQLYIKYLFLFFYINLPTFIDEEPKFCVILKKDNGFDVVDNNFDNRQLAEYRIKEIIDLKIEINPIKVKMNMDS